MKLKVTDPADFKNRQEQFGQDSVFAGKKTLVLDLDDTLIKVTAHPDRPTYDKEINIQ